MNKLMKYAAIAAIAISVVPFAAQAHDGDSDSRESDNRGENQFRVLNLDHINRGESRRGKVTAVASGLFTLEAKDGKVYTVNSANATFTLPFNGKFIASDLKVGDAVKVRGTISGTAITASSVIVVPANKRPVKGKATVSAVNGSTLTVLTKSGNTVTVNTDSNTTVTKQDGSAGAVADVQVGSKVKLAGLWDTVLNVLNAIKIKLF
jgi:hypothetical protein